MRKRLYFLWVILLFAGCTRTPSDDAIKKEIIAYASNSKCIWRIEVPKGVTKWDIHEDYSGLKIEVVYVDITAKSFKSDEGSVKFELKGRKIGKPDVDRWYGWSYKSAFPYLTDFFVYRGEWKFKKYDTGWKVAEEPRKMEAEFIEY